MNENEKYLFIIREEMENVRELYIKGYIEKSMICHWRVTQMIPVRKKMKIN